MAFNNGFPMSYQPAQMFYPQQMGQIPQIQQPSVQPPQPMQMPAPQQAPSSIIWVQGEAGAKSYLVAPNTTVQLWDSENPVIYLKSADASGMPSMKIIDYKIRDSSGPIHIPSADNLNKYVTDDVFSEFRENVEKRFKELMKGEKLNESND